MCGPGCVDSANGSSGVTGVTVPVDATDFSRYDRSLSSVSTYPKAGHVPESVTTEPIRSSDALRLVGVAKRFRRAGGHVVAAIDNISLSVAQAEIVVLLGPSGCGKTTLLRTVAGLESPDEGEIVIDDKVVYSSERRQNVPPEKRPVGMVPQSYALWPHMTVFENVAFPLRARKVPRRDIPDRVNLALATVGVPELAKQHPGRLSGGQQQRVALARAIVGGDRIVLFDEPLSNVDAKVRERLRVELLAMHAEIGFSALYVTHDQEEAMELGDRIAVLNTGRVMQIGSPRDVYERPISRYVADFVGTANEFVGTVVTVGETVEVATQIGSFRGRAGEDQLAPGDDAVAVWRPERGTLCNTPPAGRSMKADVIAELFNGPRVEYLLRVGSSTCKVSRSEPLEHDGACWLTVPDSAITVFAIRDAVGHA